MKKLILVSLLLVGFAGMARATRYVFYLHGRIVELMGPNAVETSQGYGAYEYDKILSTFRDEGFTVMSEVRGKDTDPPIYARKIVKQIDSLVQKGTKPEDITVIGASKGSVIAMYVSTLLKNKNVNFVFMGGCFNNVATEMPDLDFRGNILSIYEENDEIGRSCATLKNRATDAIPHYKEIELHTGLKHGYLYKPMKEWVAPATKWAEKRYD